MAPLQKRRKGKTIHTGKKLGEEELVQRKRMGFTFSVVNCGQMA